MGESVRLHHFGFVVAAIAPCIEAFRHSMDASWDGKIIEDPLQKVRVAFLARGEHEPQIELVEPVGDASPVRKFLAEKGGGLHHVCYETDDLKAEVQGFRSRGAILARPALPAAAFGGRKIAWVMTREKLLIEVLESTLANPAAS